MSEFEPAPPAAEPAPPAPEPAEPPRRRTYTVAAWVLILLMVAVAIVSNAIPLPDDPDADDPLGIAMARIQARYMMGIRAFVPAEELAAQTGALETGSLPQRQRYVVLAAELGGPPAGGEALARLDADLAAHADDVSLDGDRALAQRALRALYYDDGDRPTVLEGDAFAERADALDPELRAALADELGWFGELALAPEGTAAEADTRERVLSSARRTAFAIIGAVAVGLLAALAGLAGLVILGVLVARRTVRPGFGPGEAPHGIYAETFAIWMAAFFALQLAAGVVVALLGTGLWPVGIVFVMSLGALAWPVARGVPWATVRADVGLTAGAGPLREIASGAAGYAMTLPLLGVGLVGTLVLLAIQQMLVDPPGAFESASGPAHPIVSQLAESGIWLEIQIFTLAAILAPLVEETMFRGVLYRHLRDWSAGRGRVVSVLLSGGISSLLFAAIHPQGWVAIPALMGLAAGFVLVREWRGSLLGPMVVHGISNGLVMSLVLLLLGG